MRGYIWEVAFGGYLGLHMRGYIMRLLYVGLHIYGVTYGRVVYWGCIGVDNSNVDTRRPDTGVGTPLGFVPNVATSCLLLTFPDSIESGNVSILISWWTLLRVTVSQLTRNKEMY